MIRSNRNRTELLRSISRNVIGPAVFAAAMSALGANTPAGLAVPEAQSQVATPSQSANEPLVGSNTFDPAHFAPLTSATLPMEDGQRIVMRVNKVPITWDDFIAHVRLSGASVYEEHPQMEAHIASALRDTVTDALVLTAIYREFAKKHNLMPEQREIGPEKRRIITNPAGQLLPPARRLTPQQIETLATDSLIRHKVNKYIGDRATSGTPSQDELTSFAEHHGRNVQPEPTLRARHIVWRATPDMSEFSRNDAQARAQEIRQRLKQDNETTATAPQGTTFIPFAEAARQFSQDRLTAYRGGDLGYFPEGSMYQPVNEALAKLQPGEISPVVQSPVGFHIFQLLERHPDNLRLLYDRYRRDEATRQWQLEARKAATVENYLQPQN